jgi:hypothetical protein
MTSCNNHNGCFIRKIIIYSTTAKTTTTTAAAAANNNNSSSNNNVTQGKIARPDCRAALT